MGAEAEASPPLHIWIGFFAMVVGNFMAILDIQIVASSIGAIQSGVSASRDEISWVQTSYLIAEVIGIPLSGFLGRALGMRVLFCVSSLAFAFSSLLCAFSWDIGSLIVFRAMQGFSGAAMIPTTMATMFLVFPRAMQPLAGAIVGMVSTLGPTLGPTIGGYVAEALGWRALFWINLAPGLLITAVIWNLMTNVTKAEPVLLRRIDFAGLIGLALFLGAAEYVLEEGPANDWFASSEVVMWAAISLSGAMLFFWRAFTAETPIVDLRPFSIPSFSIGVTLAFIIGVGMFSSIFLTPLFLGTARGYNSVQIGQTMFVQGAVMLVSGPLIGGLMRQMEDSRWFGAIGFVLIATSCLVQSRFTAQAAFWELLWPQVFRGVGLIMTFSAVMQPSLRGLPPHWVHAGAGLFNTLRNLGGAFGIAALATIHSHAFALHRQELYSAADPANPHVQGLLSSIRAYLAQTGAIDPNRQSLMYYANILDREALVMTFNDQFLTLSAIAALSVIAIFFLKPDAPPTMARPS